MRADEPIRFYMYGTGMSQLADYINQVLYERLMAKAREFWKQARLFCYECDSKRQVRCLKIAEALEERANKIKGGI